MASNLKNHEIRATLTIEEAAERLGIGRNTAYTMAQAGQIPVLRFGRRMVVPKAAFERMLQEVQLQTQAGGTSHGHSH